MRFAFGAGGTGGHIIPALALADELKSRGHHSIFIGNAKSMEERLSADSAYPFFPIQVQKLYRKLSLSNLLFPYYLIHSIAQSRRILRSEAIDAVISTGGFVAGPVSIAALRLKLPCFLHESNSYPGLTTRYLAKHLHRLYLSFEESKRYIKQANIKNYGIPIKNQNSLGEFKLSEYGLSPNKKTLLISGGSQGSLAINTAVSAIVRELWEDGWQILWQTGSLSYEQFKAIHKDDAGLYLFEFSPVLPAMMRIANLAITRAGAMTIAELEAARLPAILIPLPTAAGNHQYYNALAQQNKQVAEILLQNQLNPQSLLALIKQINLSRLKAELNKLPENKAAQTIISDILTCLKEN